ncbi:MAG: HAD family hydrolase [Acidobacteriota bacterium]
MTGQRERAVFLDRDGTLVEDVGYPNSVDQLIIYPEVAGALHRLKAAGFRLIVLSNQSGVARGLMDPSFPDIAFRFLQHHIAWDGQPLLDGGYHCPHFSGGVVPEYAHACSCRKPEPGMLLDAARDFDLALDRCYLVGDHTSDVEAAHRAGAKGILLRTGHGRLEEERLPGMPAATQPEYVAADLPDAARWILQDVSRSATSEG